MRRKLTKALIVVTFVVAALAMNWQVVVLVAAIAGYEWGYIHGDKHR